MVIIIIIVMIIIIYSNNVQLCIKNQITICTFETWHLSIFTCVLRNIKMRVSAEKPKINLWYILYVIWCKYHKY